MRGAKISAGMGEETEKWGYDRRGGRKGNLRRGLSVNPNPTSESRMGAVKILGRNRRGEARGESIKSRGFISWYGEHREGGKDVRQRRIEKK